MAEIVDGWNVERITSYNQLTEQRGLHDSLPYEGGFYYDAPIGAPSWLCGYKMNKKVGSERFNESIKKYALWYVETYHDEHYLIKVSSSGVAHISGPQGKEFLPYEETKEILQKMPIEVKEEIGIKELQKRKETPKSLEHQRRRKISKEYQEANKDNYDYKYVGPKKTKEEKKKQVEIVRKYNIRATRELTDKLGIPVGVKFVVNDEFYDWKVSIKEMIVSIKGNDLFFKSEDPNLHGKPVLSTSYEKILYNSLGKNRKEYNKVYNEISNTLQKYKLEVSKNLLHNSKMNLKRTRLRAEYARGHEFKTTEDRLKYSAITENYFPY